METDELGEEEVNILKMVQEDLENAATSGSLIGRN